MRRGKRRRRRRLRQRGAKGQIRLLFSSDSSEIWATISLARETPLSFAEPPPQPRGRKKATKRHYLH